jgi:hypothetical protein
MIRRKGTQVTDFKLVDPPYGPWQNLLLIVFWTLNQSETPTQTMNISLPEQLKDFIDDQVGPGTT